MCYLPLSSAQKTWHQEVFAIARQTLSALATTRLEERLSEVFTRRLRALDGPTKASLASALIREYLFISLFRACAESLVSENASRLAAMERAVRNINELQEQLHSTFHRLRQGRIDEEFFDAISGFEALAGPQHP